MSPPTDIDREQKAMGSMMAALPEVAELIEYRKGLPINLTQEEVDARVLERARELGLALGGNRILGSAEVPPDMLDASLWTMLEQLLAMLRLQHGELSVRDLLIRASASIGLDQALLTYVHQSATGGAPGAFPLPVHGNVFGVSRVEIGEFKFGPLVVLAATQFSDIDQLVMDLRDKCHEDFAAYASPRTQSLDELAHIAELLREGLDRKQIAWRLLEERHPEIAAATEAERKRDYSVEYRRERARLARKLNRLERNL